MAVGNFIAGIVATPPLTVTQFFSTPAVTPGNVGVCLSGGGSRALTAGMGQLQALAYLTVNGAPMLGHVKALSTVSGGSWLGVPFEFLRPSGPSDAAYLGAFNPNQADLTPDQLAQLPAGNAGVPITSDLFLPELLALEAFLLHEFLRVPPSMLWQTVIALNILGAYGLFSPSVLFEPTDLFTYDAQSLQRDVTGPNPGLGLETADLFADGTTSGRVRRPYLICNMCMFLKEPNTQVELLAPVQATPFFTGIVGAPTGTNYNGLTTGGGGLTSFAFNSIYVSSSGASATAAQRRQWSLTDIVANIVVDESIPPLFGYQPYESGQIDQLNKGYVLYAGASGTDYPMYANNQVFPSGEFQTFLQQLWTSSGSGSAATPAVYAQSLAVQPNTWFGIEGGKTVTVVWCYLNAVSAWRDQFKNNPAVAALIESVVSSMAFPHYNTINTRLSATEVNLLAALTGWCVVSADRSSHVFSRLFTG
jgi:hypothetical protein